MRQMNARGQRGRSDLHAIDALRTRRICAQVTAEHAFIKDGCTVPQVMRTVYGPYVSQLDFAHYEQPGHERDALYDNSRVREELGFVPKVNVLTAYQA